MTDPEWRRVFELYETAGALSRDAASALLNSSAEDPAVLHEVAIMLSTLHEDAPDLAASPAQDSGPQYGGLAIGRYDVIALIGRGSTGFVYSGRDRELARLVALKFMSPDFASVGSSASRFVREAQAASALNHPNIVTVHEVTTWNGSPVIVMELVEGSALRALCRQPMPVQRAVRIGEQIMQALAAAHANGIVHRDLKPENVMVRPDNYVKVLDLGLARKSFLETGLENVSSTLGLPVGTLRYMSPEQCRGESATPLSDVFAAGIVLFEMLAGRHPFHADSPLEVAHAIASSNPPALTRLNSEVSAWLHSLIMRMLAKDAQARPSAAEVAEALLTGGSQTSRAQASGAPRLQRAFIRYGVGGLALAAALLLGLWFTRLSPRTSPASELQISPLASLRGSERHPAFSPDGKQVAFAFAGENNATPHIYIKSLSDGRLTRLTSDSLPDLAPAFSPDGSKLAFLRRVGGRLRVMVMPSSGGVEHQAGEILDVLREYALMTWDAQGENLVVADRASEARPDIALFQISLATGDRRQITFPPTGTSDWMPAISPDGQSLGFARLTETGRGDVWSIPAAGGPPRRLSSSGDVFFCWSWSEDGRDLLIGYRRAGRIHLWRQPVNGGRQVRVAGLDDQVMELSVARTGNLLTYVSGTDDDYNVWRYPLPPSTDHPKALIASAAFDGDARYSPDGAHIAFASTRSGQSEIWICSSDGSDLRQVTLLGPGGFTAGSPSWSPDGRWIAFDSRSPQSESSIFVLDVLGGKPRRLTGPGPSDIVPNWSRDSHWIYFSSDRGGAGLQIWKVPAAGGHPVQVTRQGGLEAFESPDGQFLYYTKRGRKSGFWRMPFGGGKETYVPELEPVANRYWENSAEGIYFVPPSKTPALQLFHFAGGVTSQIMDLPVPPSPVHRGITIAPDGQSFLYMQADVPVSNIMIVNNFH